ncbi:hypothetical protein [Kitasatospora sp. A2-31]|uniref:hypothetical protein n=1 Tax=Kitasatospora sp. A2-31 TaxID=2916414 RepID=UPI001EEC9765|nr:hypothetical protein [Kitasatospora sp. A2-31]MCG6497414.1 hypothetical protein [Kitasatospora sp. A2-31]
MNELQSLLALCPASGPRNAVLPTAPAGFAVPPNHRALIGAYGPGCFDEFLWVYAEGSAQPGLDLVRQTEEVRRLLREYPEPDLPALLAEDGLTTDDLVQWAGTDNADMLFWLPVGEPDDWPTLAVQAGRLRFARLPLSSTGVLLALLSGEVRLDLFPDDFPSERPEFSISPYA